MGQITQSCSVCLSSPEARKGWGCDEPTKTPQAILPFCPICYGEDRECKFCAGASRPMIYRCPRVCLEGFSREPLRLFFLFRAGYLPDAGAVMDQASPYLDAISLLSYAYERLTSDAEAKK